MRFIRHPDAANRSRGERYVTIEQAIKEGWYKFFSVPAFQYIDKTFGDGVYKGVMSDEIPQYAVRKHNDGYDRVNYSKIDVDFKRV